MWLEWPACGGSTRVGSTSSDRFRGAVTSRRWANGVPRTISLGVCQSGGRRSVTADHQRSASVAVPIGVRRL
jgi:hypothetical protein